MTLKVEGKKRKLVDYKDHSYVYGRQGQEFASHIVANIRYYEHAADKTVKQASFQREISAGLMKIESEKQAILPNQKNNQKVKTQLSSDFGNDL